MKNKSAYIWTFTSKFLPQTIYLLTTMVLARFLTPTEFGQIGAIAIFLSIASSLYEAGLCGALINIKHVTEEDKSTVWIYNTVISSLIYIILFFSAPIIELYLHSPGLCIVLRWVSLIIIVNSITAVANSMLIKNLEFKFILIVSIISAIVSGLLAIIMGINDFGVYSLVVYQITNACIRGLLISYKYGIVKGFVFDFSSFKKLFSFGAYTSLSNVVDNIYENGLGFLFGKVFNIRTVGFLTQAKKLSDSSTLAVAQTVGTAVFPIISKLDNSNDITKETATIEKYAIIGVIPAILFISLFAKEVICLLYGKSWVPSAYYLSLLLIAGVFVVMENINRNFLKGVGEVKNLFIYTILKRLGACICILIALAIDKSLIIYSYILGAFIGYITNSYIFTRRIGISFPVYVHSILSYSIPVILWYGTCLSLKFILNESWVYYVLIITLTLGYYVYQICTNRLPILYYLNLRRKK